MKNKKIFTYQNVIIIASIIPLMIFGFLTYNNSKEQRVNATFEYIQSINNEKKQLVQDYFKELEFNSKGLTKTITFLQKQATKNIVNIQSLQRNNIQNYYHSVENTTLSLAKKDIFQYIFNFLNRGKNVNNIYFKNIYSHKEKLGVSDVLMIDKNGKILYSSDNENLINTNVNELTELFGDTFKLLKEKNIKNEVIFVNTGYSKASKSYKQFAIAPFKDVNGYIAIEINQEDIQKIIKNIASLGNTAETYLAYKYKNKTFLASNRTVKAGKIGDEKNGKYILLGFSDSGTDIKYGSLGDIELVGFMPIKIKNITLSMQTTVKYTEIISPTIDGSDYFENFMFDYKYHNIMLIGPKGKIFYSIEKEDNYKTNILDGKYANTELGIAIKEVFINKKFLLTDIISYKVCTERLAQFTLTPILKKDGEIQTIAVIQVDIGNLSEKLALYNDFYKSYETYIVGEDKLLKTDTILSSKKFNVIDSLRNNIQIDTNAVKNAFSGGKSISTLEDYRGIKVLSGFSILNYPSFKWAIISEIDESEIESLVSVLKYNILMFIFISSFIALIVMIVITNEKKKQDKKLRHTATHDSLTGLPNRKFVLEFLTYILANSKRLKTKGAVLFIDLDKFKIVNDSYGHNAGDLVLKEVASRLQSAVREDDIIARLGGDEFILIINNFHTLHDIDTLCKKLILEISEPIHDEYRAYNIGISIGIAVFPDDSNDADELLQFADTAMFKTKDNGRNNFTYYSKDMTKKSLQISLVEQELKSAIQNDELVLHYQPQIDLRSSKIIGVEALVRWNHPERGLIMPNDFIPIAEDSNLIMELGQWVTYEACKNFKKWKESGVDLEYIAVNMSTKQLQCKQCVKNMKKTITTLDFKPEWLELEITENTLISNLENTLTNIDIFKDMGIKFSIDDFGTGYSSLSYLKSLPVSTLKIDREFIKDIISDKDDKAIVEAIILMGHILNYTVIAEGAETKAEIELLKYFACDVIQGYYYSKPLDEEKLLKYIKEFKYAK